MVGQNSKPVDIEPIIGHTKSDNRLDRNFLKGEEGDKINAILAGCGFNIRKLLRAILLWLFKELFRGTLTEWTTLTRLLGQQFQPV
jgi:IS5 family transposase